MTEYPVPTASSDPTTIVAGPDGALWFTEQEANKIGRITTAGVITEFAIPTPASYPYGIAAGPDGALWFTEAGTDPKIGRLTVTGEFSEYPIPTLPGHDDRPYSITAGPDGALWFTQINAGKIGRITTSGQVTEYSLSGFPRPADITAGPDGALWFAESSAGAIGKITTSGIVTEFPVPSALGSPSGIIRGPDGALWFTEFSANKIGRITTAGVISEYPIPTAHAGSYYITAGADDALWFTEDTANQIGRITTEGVVEEYPIPTAASGVQGITLGPDGALWFAEGDANQIGRFNGALAMKVTPNVDTIPSTGMITATVIITNTSLQPTSAVTLTLTEGEGALYAYHNEPGSGRFGTVAGVQNTIYFDAGAFQPQEQKTFEIPFIISPNPDADPTTTSWFTATNASNASVANALQVTATGLSEPEPNADSLDRLVALPVADVGANGDGPFAETDTRAAPRSAAGTILFPSDYGDWWQYYVSQSLDKWPTKDKVLYYTLKKAGLSAREAYGAIYLKALIGLKLPKFSGCVPSRLTLAKASGQFWWAVQKAKWSRSPNGFYDAFKTAAGTLDKCNAMYLLNAMDIADTYAGPLVEAMQDKFAVFGHKDVYFQQEMDSYVTEGISLATTPFRKLVQADLDYYLSRRRYPTKLHAALRLVAIRANTGGTRSLGAAIEEYVRCQADIAYTGCPKNYRAHNTSLLVHSPLMPVVTNALGQRSGIDAATGTLYDELPGVVIEPGHPWELTLPVNATQPLTVSWTTAYPEPWQVDVQGIYSGTVTSQQSFQGHGEAGYTALQTVQVTVGATGVQTQPTTIGDAGLYLPLLRR